jgi:hypothetical protein
VFGNFIATKTKALNQGVFADPSIGVPVSIFEAIDIDGPDDLILAECWLNGNKE